MIALRLCAASMAVSSNYRGTARARKGCVEQSYIPRWSYFAVEISDSTVPGSLQLREQHTRIIEVLFVHMPRISRPTNPVSGDPHDPEKRPGIHHVIIGFLTTD